MSEWYYLKTPILAVNIDTSIHIFHKVKDVSTAQKVDIMCNSFVTKYLNPYFEKVINIVLKGLVLFIAELTMCCK